MGIEKNVRNTEKTTSYLHRRKNRLISINTMHTDL